MPPPLTKWAALCVQHRRVVGSDDGDDLLEWIYDHIRVQRCAEVTIDLTGRIAERVELDKVVR